MATFISHSPQETETLGESWGRVAAPGLVIGLSGDLGAGKTQLVKGLARGLACHGRVHSPTFTLINEYQGGRLPLHHIDLYRLDTVDQILSAGLGEYWTTEGVSVIEWVERWIPDPAASGARLPLLYRHVRLETVDEQTRRISYEDFGT